MAGILTQPLGLLGLLLVLGGSPSAEATDLFRTRIAAGSARAVNGTNSILDVPDLFDTNVLGGVLPGFDPVTQSAVALIDMRGLPSTLTWDHTTTTLTYGLLGEKVTFRASTLDEALAVWESWLRGETTVPGADLTLTDLLQGFIEFSPVDPVAGNPNSLQSRMFQTDYGLGTEGPFTSGSDRLEPASNQWGLGIDYGYAKGGDFSVNALDLPLAYRWNLPHPKWSLLFSLPLTATFTEGRWSFLASAGIGAQYRPTSWWALTLMGRVGGAGSIDVGALALLYSVTVANYMRYEWNGIQIAMGNLVGFTKTVDGIEVHDYDFTYDLTNPVLTNGGMVSGNAGVLLLGRALGWRLFGWNTQVFGDPVYMTSQTEVGAALALLGSLGGEPFDSSSLSLSYVFGNGDYDGLSVRLRLRF